MAIVTFKGNPVNTVGALPQVGIVAPAFALTNTELREVGLADFAGKKKVLNIVPSLDTGVCALSAQRFHSELARRADVVLLNISADLPFAAGRFCQAHGLRSMVALSVFRAPAFGQDYGVEMLDGPLRGLTSRAVLVLDENDIVRYAEQVPEIAQEPNYEAALRALHQ
jgi:thioredoxin-dependent peroxiredoxin